MQQYSTEQVKQFQSDWLQLVLPLAKLFEPFITIPIVDKLISNWFDMNQYWMLQLYIATYQLYTKQDK